MRKIGLLFVGIIFVSFGAFGGEVITNDTGEDATGLRVSFSTPVLITEFGDVLTSVDPQMLSFEFVFSGGIVEPWGSHWMNWAPATASIMEYEWLTGSLPSSTSQAGMTRDDLMNLGRTPTYEEIMAEIARYPGPDEPIYVPAEDEPIWLTDLEGHADIYDNDSIKINYADWFDRSQITKIEVYRNGIKMRFLPDMLDVVTNDQMKTFDGNPAEHTPISAHTDHAITGYVYKASFYDRTGSSLASLQIRVSSSVHFSGDYRFANLNHGWWIALEGRGSTLTDNEIREFLAELKRQGFTGIQFDVALFMEGPTSNDLIAIYEESDPRVPHWQKTASDDAIARLLTIAGSIGLQTELRMEFWITEEYKNAHPSEHVYRGNILPSNTDEWFNSYLSWATHFAVLAEANQATYFCPLVEADSMQQFAESVYDLLAAVDRLFSGELIISEGTHHYIMGWFPSGGHLGTFWDYPNLVIGVHMWTPPLSSTTDPGLTQLLEQAVEFYAATIEEYRQRYPGHRLFLTEVGFYNYDGGSLGYEPNPAGSRIRDDQEMADYWSSIISMCKALSFDGMAVWNIEISWPHSGLGSTNINESSSLQMIEALISN